MSMNQVEFDLEVAELLVCSGFVMPYDLDRAHARQRGGPGVREALIEAGSLDPKMWDAAVQVIQQIRAARLPKTEARTALYMVGNCGMPIAEALAKMGYAPKPSTNPWESQLTKLRESGKFEAVS